MKFKTKLLIASSVLIKALTIIIITTLLFSCREPDKIEWISPYKEIDWDNIIQVKSHFHAHTTQSDGVLTPAQLIDAYHNAGYDVLAITDHWRVTWPWENYGCRADELGMLDIIGSEPSHTGLRQHHMVSLFSEVTGRGLDFEETLSDISRTGGLLSFAHPARSVEWNNNKLSDISIILLKPAKQDVIDLNSS